MYNRSVVMFAFSISILLALISPPFIFSSMDFTSRELRGVLVLIVFLLFALSYARLTRFDILIFSCVAVLFGIEMLWQRSQLSNIFSYYAVIIFFVLLFRVLKKHALSRELFMKLWVRIACFASISSIIVFFLHQFSLFNTDFFNFSLQGNFSARGYQYSFLGVSMPKSFGPFVLARVSGYFNEPQYAGLFFAINVLIANELNRYSNYRWLIVFSLLAGVLTFSVTFYLFIVIFGIMQLKVKEVNAPAILLSTGVLGLFIIVMLVDVTVIDEAGFLPITSLGDRVDRMSNGLDILKQSSFLNLLFGHGVGYLAGFDRGISSGFFHVLVERGIVGLCFVLTMLTIFANKNYSFMLVCMLFFFAISWYVNYIFWLSIIAFWTSNSISNTQMIGRLKNYSIPDISKQ